MPTENAPRNDFLICTGVLHDYLGSIHFIHYAKGNANVDIPEQKPFGFYGTVYYREGIYTFKIIEAMSIPMLIRKRKHDWQSGTPLDDGIKRQIKLSLAAQTCKEDLATLKKTMMQHFGSAKVQFIIDNGDSTHTTVSLPPGFTVDANNKSFISLLKKNSIITSVQ